MKVRPGPIVRPRLTHESPPAILAAKPAIDERGTPARDLPATEIILISLTAQEAAAEP